MDFYNYENNFIVRLSDTSDGVIKNNMCMDGFARHQFLLIDKPGHTVAQEVCETEFSAGDVIFVSAGKAFGIRCDGEAHVRYIAFSGKGLRPPFHYCGFGEFRVISHADKDKTYAMFDEIFRLNRAHDKNELDSSAAIYSLIAHLGAARIEADNYVYDSRSLIIRPIIDHMRKNYRDPNISVSALTSPGMSFDETNDLFLDIFSMSAKDYYKLLRMENAKHLLFFYHMNGAGYVAENMGYADEADFRNDFCAAFKITPEEFIALYHGS